MSFAFSPTPDVAPQSAFGAAAWSFPAFTLEAPASAATAAAAAASPFAASHPPSFGALAGQTTPAGPVLSSPFSLRPQPAPPAASAFGFPSGSGFPSSPFASAAGPAPVARNAFGSAAVPARVQLTAAHTHLTPTAQLLTPKHEVQFPRQLASYLQTREGVFALSWHEVSAAPPHPTLLMRYLAVGQCAWLAGLTQRGHDQAHGWIVEKLAAELTEGHGYDHEVRDWEGRGALDLLLGGWIDRPELVRSMSRVLLSAPSVAVRLREEGDRHETTRLVEVLISNLDTYPDRMEPCLAIIAMILERDGSFDQALQAIIAKSRIHLLLRVIKAASAEQLQSVSPATLHQARQLEQERPYLSLRRLCRELIERVCEWQAEALVCSLSSSTSASEPGVPSPSSSSPFAAWLSAFESALPSRMLAHQCVTRGCSEAEWLAALAQFDWLDLAEDGVMCKLMSTDAPMCATAKRVQQLADRERAHAADDEVRPASGPLSPSAIIAHLIRDRLLSIPSSYRQDPTNCALLLALVPAASVAAGSSPSSQSGGLCIPDAFELISRLPDSFLMRIALAFHEAGITADDNSSLTLHLIRRGKWAALQRWMAPDNAQFSMPLGWLGERDPTVIDPVSIQSAAPSAASLSATPLFPAAAALSFGSNGGFGLFAAGPARAAAIPTQIQPHPHLAASARCDVWDAVCRRAQSSDQDAPIQQLMSHAIDWHYATVTPQLRSALSAHLLPELHAEVLSCLMPPSTLRDPAPPATEADPSLRVLDSAVAALLPSHSAIAEQLRGVQQRLIDAQHERRVSAVERGFAERALEAERQMTRLQR